MLTSHFVVTWMPYPDYDKEAGQKTARELDEAWQPIRDQMPKSGAYVNEVSTAQPQT
jgi:hypothetical protein